MRPFLKIVLLALLLSAPAPPAGAHGPTVRVSFSRATPAQLAIPAGATVHFLNASRGATVCTVVAEDGSFASPPLARGEGWHHTFENPGTFAFTLEQSSAVRGTIVVTEPR